DSVKDGGTFCPPHIAFLMFSRLADLSMKSRFEQGITSLDLSIREIQILHLVGTGLSNKDIAQKLCISVPTVKNHIHNILQKLKVKDRQKAVECAQHKGWIT